MAGPSATDGMSCCVCKRTLAEGMPSITVGGQRLCAACSLAVRQEAEANLYRLEPLEFVYSLAYTCLRVSPRLPDDQGAWAWKWRAHAILHKTKKSLWVLERSMPAEDAGTPREDRSLQDGPYLKLKRPPFEAKGWVLYTKKDRYIGDRESIFYASPYVERILTPREVEAEEARRRSEAWASARHEQAWSRHAWADLFGHIHRDEDLRTLGLSRPFSAEELRAAYRREAKRHHPDTGGSAEEFRRINEAYERLAAGT
jgi:hypothetical protein